MKILKCYLPHGETRAVWSDQVGPSFRREGVIPQRASRIEVIQEGPWRGHFHVDFSLLSDLTGDDSFRFCLWPGFASYQEANLAEVKWLEENWVLG